MSAKAIREFDGKRMLAKWLAQNSGFRMSAFVQVTPTTDLKQLTETHPWLTTCKLVVKPDQLIKRRGKSGLIKLNATYAEVCAWITERRGKPVQVESVSGILDHFIIEPFIAHKQIDEYYICIVSHRGGEDILFHHEGGVDVGDVDSKAARLLVETDTTPSKDIIISTLLKQVPAARQGTLGEFLTKLFEVYVQLHFTYMEINPLIVLNQETVIPLDLAAKIDETARFECGQHWGPVDFPPPFGRPYSTEEEHIRTLDAQTGASLKLTVLNPKGRIWTMVAGGGASVIYADTISDLGGGGELANYGEYSGAPTVSQTFEYAKTVIDLMTRESHPQGKILLIGGGIANFTDVAATFKGIINALTQNAEKLKEHKVKIFIRRGGPNWQQGLENMRAAALTLRLPIEVFGPDSHMTSIVSKALGLPEKDRVAKSLPKPPPQSRSLLDLSSGDQSQPLPSASESDSESEAKEGKEGKGGKGGKSKKERAMSADWMEDRKAVLTPADAPPVKKPYELFTRQSRAMVYGLQTGAVQNMLDFDFVCARERPSVAGMIYPFMTSHYEKFYWATKEILIPIYQDTADAMRKNPDVDIVVNFSSFRSVYESTLEILKYPQIKTIAIIAEGVPERRTRSLIKIAAKQGVTIIGPATVGGIKPGCFRIGNTGGMLDNIIASKLYRPGSVAYVARSGGMSNELNNIIARNSDGVYEGIAIGGDRYPGTTFTDHLLRFEADPHVKIMVVLGEVGGIEEYEVCKLVEHKKLTKPIIAWCIGTCARMFPYQVQFGHAGACANSDLETAVAKNEAMKKLGIMVPTSFEDFGLAINHLHCKLVDAGTIKLRRELAPPNIPVDYAWARKLGLIRKPAAFVSSIVDERGEELIYAGMKISDIFKSSLGVGGVIGLIWFRKQLPDYFSRFIELVMMVTADHGPAVAGAHNTIVTARAGKDLISSLVSGLLTIGPRFGGALDGAAARFSEAYDAGLTPEAFVSAMHKKKELIPGIGHKVKSLENPDARVTIVKAFAKQHFKSTEVLNYACQVELVTTKKKSNLILNVDGAIGVAFVDLMRSCGAFTLEESNEYINMGVLNGLFVLGRSIGFIGHYVDQNRLKQGLYRHPTEDISYLVDSDLTL